MEDYNKLLEKARDAYSKCVTGAEKRRLESIFPELAESLDEKIKKEILDYFKDLDEHGYSTKEWTAWVEKHGKNDSQAIFPTFTFDDILALECCMKTAEKEEKLYKQLQSLHNRVHDAYWLEKQGEQKHVWSEEDEMMLTSTINSLKLLEGSGATDIKIEWLKTLGQKFQCKPSEEQINALEHFVRSIGESGYASHYDNNIKLIYSLLNDLKNIRHER